jgi:hypothetical protein
MASAPFTQRPYRTAVPQAEELKETDWNPIE